VTVTVRVTSLVTVVEPGSPLLVTLWLDPVTLTTRRRRSLDGRGIFKSSSPSGVPPASAGGLLNESSEPL
jgi:hypothetical protein